jgi:hypothetical protein
VLRFVGIGSSEFGQPPLVARQEILERLPLLRLAASQTRLPCGLES